VAYTNTASNVYNQPLRSAQFGFASSAIPTGTNSIATIPIPPTHTLNIGVSGSASTSATSVYVRPINPDGTYATAVKLTLLDPTASTRMNATFAGSSYPAVQVYLKGDIAATLTIASMMARLVETGRSLTLTGNHMPGEGHTGLEFSNDAIVENYTYMYPPRKGISTTLVEVGAWR